MKKTVAILILGFLMTVSPVFALTVVTSDDGNALAGGILGAGITTVGTVTYTGSSSSSGFFADGLSSGIGMETGIILTSGDAMLAAGPNMEDDSTGVVGTGYDADLAPLIPGYSIQDTSFLQFDFETAGGDLYFNYVFASEEYNEYTNSEFNDVFGFFLDGVNIALIPGTNTPVSINNVNGGNPYGAGASHAEFFNNNDLSDGGPFYDLGYDGFTDVFTAFALDLSAGIHTIKLAIADAGDSILDSAVFIQGGSFSDTPVDPGNGTAPVPEPGTIILLGSGLLGLAFARRKIKK
ncbi:PEP-CTERM protein-sorting domain-containing protein [Desulfuromusa kysingii]|uniref:PEP-CTERM protein-sorting domain-containing protein n=1 Tax=Desulfuromusa kysingii TaxID=37625 RepID=A0A1H3Y554_9BACT|nr:choice-of-anchor L domain-containing protein [Desulfuromusa kysingii]SEA06723.1 PEP-CTERM protein-sorting domain-containing protein [Desulfuromusa kysingii]